MYPFGSSYVPSSRGRIQRRRMYPRGVGTDESDFPACAETHDWEAVYIYMSKVLLYLKDRRNTLSRGKNCWHIYRLFGIDQSKADPGRNRAKSNQKKLWIGLKKYSRAKWDFALMSFFESNSRLGRNQGEIEFALGNCRAQLDQNLHLVGQILFRSWLLWWIWATNF